VSITTVLCHPRCNNTGILKRIPKGDRPAVTNLLSKLIRNVLQHPLSTSSWSKLLGFPSACLAKPLRGGKSRNLPTHIVKQIYEYDYGAVEPPPEPPGYRPPRRTIPPKKKSHDEAIAMLASVKLEDGDVKGAVHLLCSDDRLASPDETTFDELHRLHPAAPSDRRLEPTTDVPPLQVHLQRSVRLSNHSPMVQRLAQTVFGHNI